MEREQSAEAQALLYQPGSYPSCETNNNPQIYENIESYIAGEQPLKCRLQIKDRRGVMMMSVSPA